MADLECKKYKIKRDGLLIVSLLIVLLWYSELSKIIIFRD